MAQKTISAYGPNLIAHSAQTVIDQNSSNRPDNNHLEESLVRIRTLLSDESFAEKMLYAHVICDEYDSITHCFESKQREVAFTDSRDWRGGVLSGLYRITEAAILEEAKIRLTDAGSTVKLSTEKTEKHTYDPKEIETIASELANKKRKLELKPGVNSLDLLSTEEYKNAFGNNTSFIKNILILVELTELYGLKSWGGKSDTAVQQKIAYNGFIEGIESTLPKEIALAIE